MRSSRFIAVVLILVLAVCQGSERSIIVGSKPFTENYVLAELLCQLIETNTNYDVERKFGLEGTWMCFRALERGEIDLYPEYTGTGALVILKSDNKKDQQFENLRNTFEERFGITWLEPFGFNNSWALVVPEALAVERNLQTYSQLAEQTDLQAAFTHESLERKEGWPGLRVAYGFQFEEVRGIRHSLAYSAIMEGIIKVTEA